MFVLDYIETHPGVFAAVALVLAALNLVRFHRHGLKAEHRFRNQEHQPIRFRERGASGYSKKSLRTKLGGANRVLDVVVTDAEVWIKGKWPLFSFIGSNYDMLHRVQRSQIRAVQARDNEVDLRFTNEVGTETHIVLLLKAPKVFLAALDA